MTPFESIRCTLLTGGAQRMPYSPDNFGYYCVNYRIQYAEKGVRDGNLYATGIKRVGC